MRELSRRNDSSCSIGGWLSSVWGGRSDMPYRPQATEETRKKSRAPTPDIRFLCYGEGARVVQGLNRLQLHSHIRGVIRRLCRPSVNEDVEGASPLNHRGFLELRVEMPALVDDEGAIGRRVRVAAVVHCGGVLRCSDTRDWRLG